MNDFLLLMISLSLSGSLVGLTLILLKPLLRCFSKKWHYYIWLLVIVRLLIPFSLDVNIVGEMFQQVETHFTAQYAQIEEPSESGGIVLSENTLRPDAEKNGKGVIAKTDTISACWENHIWGALWLIVAIALLLRKIYGYRQLVKTVRQENQIINDHQLLNILQTVSAELGIKEKVPLCSNPFIQAPMLTGIMKPMIVLPARAVSSPELECIFRHELTHYHRRDFLYKWLTEITVCLHWFNPFVYMLRKEINKECEFSCDEAVVSRMSNKERRTYGDTLLNSINLNQIVRKDIVSLSLTEDGNLMKERLGAIMQYKQKSKSVIMIAVVLTLLLLFGAVFAGAYTVKASENTDANTSLNPIRISSKTLEAGGKISLGSQQLQANTQCKASLAWKGNGELTVLCTSADGSGTFYPVHNGKPTSFQIATTGKYTVAIRNEGTEAIKDITGSITFSKEGAKGQSGTVVYENVEMRRYKGEGGHPYIHDILTNNTKKKIKSYQVGMLAFDKKGNPLKINWYSTETKPKSTFYYSYRDEQIISPGKTFDVFGGWSLNIYGQDKAVAKIAYVLYCNKSIKFTDGTLWKNKDFTKWRTKFEGKKVNVKTLKSYYPYIEHIVI